MPKINNTKYQINVILAFLGITGIMLLTGSVVFFLNQISGKFQLN